MTVTIVEGDTAREIEVKLLDHPGEDPNPEPVPEPGMSTGRRVALIVVGVLTVIDLGIGADVIHHMTSHPAAPPITQVGSVEVGR